LFAGLATLWFVFQSFVVKEDLFARSPDEVFVAVNAPDGAVLKFAFLSSFHYLCGFHVYHDLLPSGPLPILIMPAGDKYKMREQVRSSVLVPRRVKSQPVRAAIGQLVYIYVENVSR
jgi:hypothetical protein